MTTLQGLYDEACLVRAGGTLGLIKFYVLAVSAESTCRQMAQNFHMGPKVILIALSPNCHESLQRFRYRLHGLATAVWTYLHYMLAASKSPPVTHLHNQLHTICNTSAHS